MSSVKVSALSAKTSPSGSEELLINDGGTSKKITIANLPDNDTTYSTATATTEGLVKIEDNAAQTIAANTVTATASRTYGVQLNASDQAVVNVPWTDTDTGITDVVDDTTPQLGGNLDFQTHKATSFTSTGIDDNATSTAITIDASENVGIGVVPEAWHSVQQDALQIGLGGSLSGYATGASVSSVALSSNIYSTLGSALNGHKYINAEAATTYQQYAGAHNFRVAASGTADSAISWTTAMTIDNDGKTTLAPNTSMSSGGLLNLRRDSASRIVETMSFDASGQYHYVFENNSGVLVGNITVTTTGTAFNTSSDYRLKENVVPMSGSIDRLKALKPSRFNFIADATKTVDGFLAHEAGEVVPECATGTKDGMEDEEYEVTPAVMDGDTVVTEAIMGTRSVPDYQSIDQSKLVPLLVASLQEAVAKIEALEARVTALEV